MSETRAVEQCSSSFSSTALAHCVTNFPTQANVTLVDGHEDDALPNAQRKKEPLLGVG